MQRLWYTSYCARKIISSIIHMILASEQGSRYSGTDIPGARWNVPEQCIIHYLGHYVLKAKNLITSKYICF